MNLDNMFWYICNAINEFQKYNESVNPFGSDENKDWTRRLVEFLRDQANEIEGNHL